MRSAVVFANPKVSRLSLRELFNVGLSIREVEVVHVPGDYWDITKKMVARWQVLIGCSLLTTQMISVSARLTSAQSALTCPPFPIFLFPHPLHTMVSELGESLAYLAFLLRPYQLKFFQQRCRPSWKARKHPYSSSAVFKGAAES